MLQEKARNRAKEVINSCVNEEQFIAAWQYCMLLCRSLHFSGNKSLQLAQQCCFRSMCLTLINARRWTLKNMAIKCHKIEAFEEGLLHGQNN